MSSNRLSYDKCSYAKEVEQSTSPLNYQMFKGKYENCKKCAKGDHTNVLDFGVRADVESELRNQTRSNSNCPSKKYNPKKAFKGAKITHPGICDINVLALNNLGRPTGPGYDVSKLAADSCAKN
jgi:hypothetical protein